MIAAAIGSKVEVSDAQIDNTITVLDVTNVVWSEGRLVVMAMTAARDPNVGKSKITERRRRVSMVSVRRGDPRSHTVPTYGAIQPQGGIRYDPMHLGIETKSDATPDGVATAVSPFAGIVDRSRSGTAIIPVAFGAGERLADIAVSVATTQNLAASLDI